MAWAESKAEYDYEYQRGKRRDRQEIGPISACGDPAFREDCRLDFGLFCKSYGAEAFPLAWSANHLKAIERIERAILHGGQFAFAMPRGSGKSSLCRYAVIWAIVYGHRRYVVFVTATETLASKQLKAVKSELRFNRLLCRDFPEVCEPIVALAGESRNASGQRLNGESTGIEWNADRLVTATVIDENESWPNMVQRNGVWVTKSSGAVIESAGITGDIRGKFHSQQDGSIIRPDLSIVDDPQTRESAKSPMQVENREATISGDVAYLAGPGVPIALFVPCTIIYENDLASKLLDRKLHPEFQGERTRMVNKFPTDVKRWETYADLLRADWEAGDNLHAAATGYYAENRRAMDAGGEVSWPERFAPHELSALQSAMNLRIKDEQSFMAECQNEPIGGRLDSIEIPTSDEVAGKANGVKRGTVPNETPTLTAFIDVSQKVLWWAVVGWGQNFTGAVIDYGTWPRQRTSYVTLSTVGITIQKAAAAALGGKPGLEGSIRWALESLCENILGREWLGEDGATPYRVERCLIDANWTQSREVVYTYARRGPFASVIMPSHGFGRGATDRGLCDLQAKALPGERRGLNWRIMPGQKGEGRRALYDTNYWKSHVFNRLATPAGDPGSLTLFAGKPADHRMFAEQVCAEYAVRVRAKGREVDEWKLLPGKTDNHFLDSLTGCAVGASLQGIALPGQRMPAPAVKRRKRAPVSYLGA